jgi:hypothetical protein
MGQNALDTISRKWSFQKWILSSADARGKLYESRRPTFAIESKSVAVEIVSGFQISLKNAQI